MSSNFELNLNQPKLSRLLSTKFNYNKSVNRKIILIFKIDYSLYLLIELLFLNFVDSRRESLVWFKFNSNFDDFWLKASFSRLQNSKSKKQCMGVISVMFHFIWQSSVKICRTGVFYCVLCFMFCVFFFNYIALC